jgi:hypothetical protein
MSFFLKRHSVSYIFTVLCVVFLTNCNSTQIVVEKNTSHKSNQSVPHAVKGPPPWAPAHGYRAKYKYHYYPSSRVYYDTGRRIYFYYNNGDWRVSVSLPNEIRIDVDDFVGLEMDVDKPYRYHSEVEKEYPPGKAKKKNNNKKDKNKWKG